MRLLGLNLFAEYSVACCLVLGNMDTNLILGGNHEKQTKDGGGHTVALVTWRCPPAGFLNIDTYLLLV